MYPIKHKISVLLLGYVLLCIPACKNSLAEDKKTKRTGTVNSLINTAHLDQITVPVAFSNGTSAAGLYVYTQYPAYTPVYATGEGFACVDDVARGLLFYTRSDQFATDAGFREKAYNQIRFVLNMQSANGYFYNFIETGNVINTSGITSVNQANWWSWRALQALTEGVLVVKSTNPALAAQMDVAIQKLISRIKLELVNTPRTTAVYNGITIPTWLPGGSDAGATLVLGLIPYCKTTDDPIIKNYIRLLADGIVMMQAGDATHFPFSCIISSGVSWHAYGSEQAHALFEAGKFFNEPAYTATAKAEVDHFFPYLIQNGYLASFDLHLANGVYTASNTAQFAQISYSTAPLILGVLDAYDLTGDQKYATMATTIAGWYFGKNPARATMYTISTGRAYDGIVSPSSVNMNSGGESVVEALVAMQRISNYPAIKASIINDL